MTVLRAMAPFVAGIAPDAGVADRAPDEYRAFWGRVDAALGELREVDGVDSVCLEHLTEREAASQYQSIAADSLPRSPHLITIRLSKTYAWPALPEHVARVEEAVLRVYPHRIGLLEVSLELGTPPTSQSASARWLESLQHDSVAFTEQLTDVISERVVEPLRAVLARTDAQQRFVRADVPDKSEPLVCWVSRSLLVDADRRDLLGYWTKDTVDDETAHLRMDVLNGDRDSLVRWLNYGFVDTAQEGAEALRSGAHGAEYAGLRFAQETYASLDTVDSMLQRVLADASAADKKWQLEQLRGDLIWLSQRAELIIMERQQLLKYMTRRVRAHFETILSAWEYDRLVEEPVRFKIELCHRRLTELGAKRAARSSLVTDLILLGIGITSIAGTAIAISEFGRTSASDPASTGFDLGASRFTSWFSSQPIDVVLLASAAASSVLVAFYLYFRRDDGTS